MKIIKAINYGFRFVVWVCENPDQPQFVHPVKGPAMFPAPAHTEATARGVYGRLDPRLNAGTQCHLCVTNWKISTFQWDGDNIPTPDEALELIRAEYANKQRPNPIEQLEGIEI